MSSSPSSPILQAARPWHQRILYNVRSVVSRTGTNLWLSYFYYRHPPQQPDEVKSYPSHAHLSNRIFLPPGHKVGDSPPLLLDIHGGGFILFDPSLDDTLNKRLSQELNCMVISLDYSKAPGAKFPTATDELVDTILDILADQSLSFDRSRVVVTGHSAGGNLSISCAQSPKLQGKLAGAAPVYPATDVTGDIQPKALLRPYDTADEVDMLLNSIDGIVYAYIKPDQDLRDPRVSTLFAPRAVLPEYIMVIAAEHDILAHEGWRSARRYAGLDDTVDWEEDQETKYEFENDDAKVKFLMIKGALHGFTHFAGAQGEKEAKRKSQELEAYDAFKTWLEKGPFAVR